MNAQGYGGYFMHARIGLETKYLGGDWFKAVQACMEEGQRTGMGSWIYDEDMYPSGVAGGFMNEDWMRAQGIELVEGRISELEQDLKRPDVLAAFAISLRRNDAMNFFRKIGTGGRLAENEKLMLANISKLEGTPEYNNGTPYVDLLNPAVTANPVRSTYAYRAFEVVLPAGWDGWKASCPKVCPPTSQS